jgi:phosphoribosyl-AMP cyclohydrolase
MSDIMFMTHLFISLSTLDCDTTALRFVRILAWGKIVHATKYHCIFVMVVN